MKPEDVLRGLCRAVLMGDADKLAALCTEQQTTILDHFEEWSNGAAAMKESPESMQAISICLQLVAEMFADAGIPQPLETLGRRTKADALH
ncbi:MAG: hypothetical protein KIT84_02135 [Labilithrix sp.]|nr:hypothetical protein [Labilithrix sp.]MCW5809788.1 hypothetical protein [Labilithrix sp.]